MRKSLIAIFIVAGFLLLAFGCRGADKETILLTLTPTFCTSAVELSVRPP